MNDKVIQQQIILIQGEASIYSYGQTGIRGDIIHSTTPPPRRVWTRLTLNTIRLFIRAISVSSTGGVSHVSIKETIEGSLER